ncbi:MAG: HAMP domain-containing protein [Clostridia bacterium]|nr:HAMP domain-containing protein [Clostridia bacterium]
MRRLYGFIVLALIITITTVTVLASNSDAYRMASLADAGEASNAILVHEVSNSKSKIIKMDRQGNVIFEKQLKARSGSDFYLYNEFTVGEDGRVYVLVGKGRSMLSLKEELVFVYDSQMNQIDEIPIITYDGYHDRTYDNLDCVDGQVYVLDRYTGQILDVTTGEVIGAIYTEPQATALVKDFVMVSKNLIYISTYRGEIIRYKDGVFQEISKSFESAKRFVPDYLGVDSKGDLYLINLYDMNLYKYVDESWQMKWHAEDAVNASYKYGDFTKLAVDENGNVAAISRDPEDILFMDDQSTYVVEVKPNYVSTYGKLVLVMFFGLLILFAGFNALIDRIVAKKGRLPLAFKQSLIVSGMLLVTISIVGFIVVDDVIDIMEDNKFEKLNAIAFEKVKNLDLDEYRSVSVLEEYGMDNYNDLQMRYLPAISFESDGITGFDDTLYFDTYMLEDGSLFRGINYDMMGYERLHRYYEDYYKVVKDGSVYNGIVKDDSGTSWMQVVIPIVEDDKIIGVFEVGSAYRKFLADTETVQASFIKLAVATLIIAMISIVIVINKLLNNLKIMTDAVERIGKGDLEVNLKVTSGDEFGVFASNINKMVTNIKRNMNKVYAVNAAYSRFVPKAIEQLLCRDDLMHIKDGEEVEIRGHLIYIKYKSIMSESTYNLLNEQFPKLLRLTVNNGGILLENTSEGIKILFEDSGKALAMLDQYVDLLKEVTEDYMVLMDNRQVRYSVVGDNQMLVPMFYSPSSGLFETMANRAEALNCRYLITDSAVTALEYQMTNLRRVGRSEIMDTQVFEYLEYESAKSKKEKLQTRRVFEEGIFAYDSGDYVHAIDCFIKVIAIDSEDKISKTLLSTCQAQLSS